MIIILMQTRSCYLIADKALKELWSILYLFTLATLITTTIERVLHVIGMPKYMQNNVYRYNETYYLLKTLLQKFERMLNLDMIRNFSSSVIVETTVTNQNSKDKICVRKNRNNTSKVLTLLSTNTKLLDLDIIQTYVKRNIINQIHLFSIIKKGL